MVRPQPVKYIFERAAVSKPAKSGKGLFGGELPLDGYAHGLRVAAGPQYAAELTHLIGFHHKIMSF